MGKIHRVDYVVIQVVTNITEEQYQTDLKDTESINVDQLLLAQNRFKCQVAVNMFSKLGVP